MSNRQARREANRKSRQKVAQQGSGGPSRGSGGGWGPLEFMKSPFPLGAAALALGLFGIIIFLAVTSSDEDTALVDALAVAHENFPTEMADGVSVGEVDAPIQIDMYEDFQCPFCLRFTTDEEPTIIEEYVKTGKVRLTFKNLPILGTSESTLAAVGGLCAAEQGDFWDYQNRLFSIQAAAGQATHEQIDVGRFTEAKLSTIAADLGMDQPAFEACQVNPDTLEAVQEQRATALSLGLTGTPSFIFNGQPSQGASGPQGWRDLLDELLDALEADAQPAVTETPAGDAGPSAPTAEPTTN